MDSGLSQLKPDTPAPYPNGFTKEFFTNPEKKLKAMKKAKPIKPVELKKKGSKSKTRGDKSMRSSIIIPSGTTSMATSFIETQPSLEESKVQFQPLKSQKSIPATKEEPKPSNQIEEPTTAKIEPPKEQPENKSIPEQPADDQENKKQEEPAKIEVQESEKHAHQEPKIEQKQDQALQKAEVKEESQNLKNNETSQNNQKPAPETKDQQYTMDIKVEDQPGEILLDENGDDDGFGRRFDYDPDDVEMEEVDVDVYDGSFEDAPVDDDDNNNLVGSGGFVDTGNLIGGDDEGGSTLISDSNFGRLMSSTIRKSEKPQSKTNIEDQNKEVVQKKEEKIEPEKEEKKEDQTLEKQEEKIIQETEVKKFVEESQDESKEAIENKSKEEQEDKQEKTIEESDPQEQEPKQPQEMKQIPELQNTNSVEIVNAENGYESSPIQKLKISEKEFEVVMEGNELVNQEEEHSKVQDEEEEDDDDVMDIKKLIEQRKKQMNQSSQEKPQQPKPKPAESTNSKPSSPKKQEDTIEKVDESLNNQESINSQELLKKDEQPSSPDQIEKENDEEDDSIKNMIEQRKQMMMKNTNQEEKAQSKKIQSTKQSPTKQKAIKEEKVSKQTVIKAEQTTAPKEEKAVKEEEKARDPSPLQTTEIQRKGSSLITITTTKSGVIMEKCQLKKTKKQLDKETPKERIARLFSIENRVNIIRNIRRAKHIELEEIDILIDPLDELEENDRESFAYSRDYDVEQKLEVSYDQAINGSNYKVKLIMERDCPYIDDVIYKKGKKPEGTIIRHFPPYFTFVGTGASSVHVFSDENKELITTLEMPVPKQTVTALDMFFNKKENPFLGVGLSGGHVVIFDLKTNKLIKAISKVQVNSITALKFYNSDPLKFLAGDKSGELYNYVVEKKIMGISESHKLVHAFKGSPVIDIQHLAAPLRIKGQKDLEEEQQAANVTGAKQFFKQITKETPKDPLDNIVVAASMSKVVVAKVDLNNFDVRWSFDKPVEVSSEELPTTSWGNAFFNEKVKKMFLVISWGEMLYLIEFMHEYSTMTFLRSGQFKHDTGILSVSWISENVVAVLDNKQKYTCIDVVKFTQGDKMKILNTPSEESKSEEQEETKPENAPEEFVNQIDIVPKISERSTFMDSKKKERTLYQASTSTNWGEHEQIILTEEKTIRICYGSALNYLDNLLEKRDWVNFLKIGLSVFNLRLQGLYDIPKDKEAKEDLLIPYFRQKILDYFEEYVKKSKDPTINYKQLVSCLVDFLAEIEDFDFLFFGCYKTLASQGLQVLFYEYLEILIQLDRIKYIPDDSLRVIAPYYCNKGKTVLIQQLIFNLDLTKVNCFVLMQLCLEFELYPSLIYVCNVIQNSYVTPFVQLINNHRNAQLTKEEDKAERFGNRSLWYVKLCLTKRIIMEDVSDSQLTDEETSQDRWKKAVFQLIGKIFEKENLKLMLNFNSDISINLITMFFEGQICQVVEENYGNFRIKGSTQEGDLDNIHYQMYYSLLSLIDEQQIQECTKFAQVIGFFHAKIASQMKFSFLDRKYCIKFARMFIVNPKLLTQKLILFYSKMKMEIKGKSMKTISSHLTSLERGAIEEYRSQMILDLLKYCHYNMSSLLIDEFADLAKESDLFEVRIFLLTINRRYLDALKVFLIEWIPQETKLKFFTWIDEIFAKLRNSDSYDLDEALAQEKLQNEIVNELEPIFRIDSQKALYLVRSNFRDRLYDIQKKYEHVPEIRFELFKA